MLPVRSHARGGEKEHRDNNHKGRRKKRKKLRGKRKLYIWTEKN